MGRALVFAAALLAAAAGAQAQTRGVMSTPIVVHAGAAGGEGVITQRTQIVLTQKVTTIRAAVLDDPIARPNAEGRQREGFLPGERLFGVYDGYDAWGYCALREGFRGDFLTCYSDRDNDGRIDTARPSGAPFIGVPFFIYIQDREQRALSAPAAYHRVPYGEGPSIDAAIQITMREPRTRQNGRVEPGSVSGQFGFIVDGRFIGLQTLGRRDRLSANLGVDPVTIEVSGAKIEFSGAPVRGVLRYRIVEPIPARIERVELQIVQSYGYTYVPIYIPR